MSFLEFILSFCLLSLVGSGAIYGWFLVTRGSWEITPDGKWKKTGMLFKYWSLFWEQYRKTERVYWKGKYLDDKIDLLESVNPALGKKIFLAKNGDYAYTDAALSPAEIQKVQDTLLVKVEQLKENLSFYTDEPKYDWPEWIQKPLSSCPTCLAGPYGTILWLLFLKLQRGAFNWTDSPILAKVCFGLIFLLTLSQLNTYTHKILKNV